MADHGKQSQQLAATLKKRLSKDDLTDIHQLVQVSGISNADPVSPTASRAHYGDVMSSVVSSVLQRQTHLKRQKSEASGLLEELLSHPPERREVLARNSKKYLNHALIDLLRDLSLDACFRKPSEAISLARLAVSIAERLPGQELGAAAVFDLRARSLGVLANAYRVSSEPQLAEATLDKAEMLLEEGGSGDLLESASLISYRAALLGNQRRPDESIALFDKAIRIYRQCGEDHLQGRTVIHKAHHIEFAGDPEQAIQLLSEGLSLIDSRKEPRLALVANHNLALYLTELGRYSEAEELQRSSRRLYEEFGDRLSLMRLRWIEAKMALGRGELEVAEAAFLETREAFIREDIAWDVALVSLELAGVYLKQGRAAEIKTLADEILPISQATGLHREALASLILFHKAAELEKVTAGLIRQTMTQLHSLRRDR